MSKYTIEAIALNGDSVEFDLSDLMPAKYGDDDVFYVNDVAHIFSSIKCVEHDEARAQLAAAQARIAELTKALDRKNDVIEGWRGECVEHADARATAEKRVAELEAERADLLWAAQWFESGRGRTRYFGNDDEMILARMEQARNNERASEIIRRAALAG